MRTWPEPSILPSMVRSAAISDSLPGAGAGSAAGVALVRGKVAGAKSVLAGGVAGSRAAKLGVSASFLPLLDW